MQLKGSLNAVLRTVRSRMGNYWQVLSFIRYSSEGSLNYHMKMKHPEVYKLTSINQKPITSWTPPKTIFPSNQQEPVYETKQKVL